MAAGAARAPLHSRNFRLLLGGQFVSVFGDMMLPVALSFAVLDGVGGAGDVGLILSSATVPLVVFLLIGGVVADRLPRRRLMVLADLVRAAAQGTLAAGLLTGHAPLWLFFATAPVWGGAAAFFNPAATALWPQTVPADDLQAANALRGTTQALAQLGGPALAGLLVAGVGAGWAVAADASTFLVSAVSVLALSELRDTREPDDGSFLRRLAEGWRAFRSRSWLWFTVAGAGVFQALAGAPVLVLGAVVAKRSLGGASAWGFALTAAAVGGLLGAVVSTRLRPKHPMAFATVSLLPYALFPAALALRSPLPALAAAGAAGGFGLAMFDTLWDTTLAREVPPHLLARVSAYDWLGSNALRPVGLALVGPMIAVFGLTGSLWLATAISLLSPLCCLCVPSVRRLSPPPKR